MDPDVSKAEEAAFREYRPPRGDGEVLIDPPLGRVAGALRENVHAGWRSDPFWSSLRRQARAQVVTDAIRYSTSYRDVGPAVAWAAAFGDATDGGRDATAEGATVDWASVRGGALRGGSLRGGASTDPDQGPPILMAGHQPTLFHPGVWFKNFALDRLASRHGAVPINLVIDNDVAPPPSIRVPRLTSPGGGVQLQTIAYDRPGGGLPFEQSLIGDRERFDRFDADVRQAIYPLVQSPSVTELWAFAREAIARCSVAGCALAQARHRLEATLGLQTLEIPLGVAVRGPAFARFVLAILRDPAKFRATYNDAVGRYRASHGIRSKSHPVPDLARDGDWFEAPLWVYGNDRPQRRAVWVRYGDGKLTISDRSGSAVQVDTRDETHAAEQLAAAASPQFKLRPRALLTTMYARLVLSDLFLHGIGGGKYDQLGDMVIHDHFGIRPPTFQVISATHRLPGRAEPAADEQIRQLKRQIRDTYYRPEAFLSREESSSRDKTPSHDDGGPPEAGGHPSRSQIDRLVERKLQRLSEIPPRGQKQAWHDEITAINDTLSATLDGTRRRLEKRLADARQRGVSERILGSREHPFCLYPLEDLRATYADLLSDADGGGVAGSDA